MIQSVFKIVLLVSVLLNTVNSSAIPMWEYLTQPEKVMYLYNMFQNQVQDYCESTTCKHDLKNYGWNKLKTMGEDHLDKMDPFQRDSNSIIWESVMEGHEMMKSTPKPKITTEKDTYEEDHYAVIGAESIETYTKIAPSKKFKYPYPTFTIMVGKPEYKIKPDDSSYTSSNRIQDLTTENIPIIDNYGDYQRIPLTGPMVIKVHPDGTPVKGEKQVLPEDDDLKQYQLTKTVYQNL